MKTFKLENETKIETGFKTPDNYFENFSSQFLQNLPKEEIVKEVKVISIFRKRRTLWMAIAAVLIIALMIPILNTPSPENRELDSATLENYLAEESNMNHYELIGEIEIETKSSNIITPRKEAETETLEEILVNNPNIVNLIIEN